MLQRGWPHHREGESPQLRSGNWIELRPLDMLDPANGLPHQLVAFARCQIDGRLYLVQ